MWAIFRVRCIPREVKFGCNHGSGAWLGGLKTLVVLKLPTAGFLVNSLSNMSPCLIDKTALEETKLKPEGLSQRND